MSMHLVATPSSVSCCLSQQFKFHTQHLLLSGWLLTNVQGNITTTLQDTWHTCIYITLVLLLISSFYTSSIFLGRLAAPNLHRLLQLHHSDTPLKKKAFTPRIILEIPTNVNSLCLPSRAELLSTLMDTKCVPLKTQKNWKLHPCYLYMWKWTKSAVFNIITMFSLQVVATFVPKKFNWH